MMRFISLFLVVGALGCAKNLDELAPFPCADDATCPEDFVCLPRSAVGDDVCEFAFDGACDEPDTCDPFTDTTDCAALASQAPVGDNSCEFAFDDVCDEPGACAPGTDLSDCSSGGGADSCQYARDGTCDEPILCSTGEDSTDCRSVPFCVAQETADERSCDGNEDCGPAQHCEAGLCVAGGIPADECDLFVNDCVDGVCAAVGSDAAGYATTCGPFPPNQLPPGSNCNGNGPTCGPGTACYGDDVNGFFCFLLCDDAHACPFGSCTFFPTETFGRCT